MPLSVIVSFVVVFALMLLAVSVGLKFFDARRKKQVVDMLHTASGDQVITVGNLLKEIENFFESYNQVKGKKFKVLGRHGPKRAVKLVKGAMKR